MRAEGDEELGGGVGAAVGEDVEQDLWGPGGCWVFPVSWGRSCDAAVADGRCGIVVAAFGEGVEDCGDGALDVVSLAGVAAHEYGYVGLDQEDPGSWRNALVEACVLGNMLAGSAEPSANDDKLSAHGGQRGVEGSARADGDEA